MAQGRYLLLVFICASIALSLVLATPAAHASSELCLKGEPLRIVEEVRAGAGHSADLQDLSVDLTQDSPAIVVTVDGLSFVNTFIGSESEECENYLENALEAMGLDLPDSDILSFEWSLNGNDTPQTIEELRHYLRSCFTRARNEGKQLIVVGHSWGTFLTYMALSYESTVEVPVFCDLYITLGSPLGSYYAHDGLYLEELLVYSYVDKWLDTLDFTSCENCRPLVARCVNYWAWGDPISGPLGDFMPAAENIQLDSYSREDGLCGYVEGYTNRNILTVGTWHRYDSLRSGCSPDNQPLRDMIKELIEETIDDDTILQRRGNS